MLEALLWGVVSASSLIVGCCVALWLKPSQRVTGLVMAFGAGVLISAVAYELVLDAVDDGSAATIAAGIFAGALTFFIGDALIDRAGGEKRKHSSAGKAAAGAGALAIVLGTALDGVPESIVLGLDLLEGEEGGSFLA